MKTFFQQYSYSIVKMFVNQFAISLFGTLLAMATIREVFGASTFAGLRIPVLCDYNVPILCEAPGGFLVFGILIALVNKFGKKKGVKPPKEFSCAGCPSAALCGKASCNELAELTEENETDKE